MWKVFSLLLLLIPLAARPQQPDGNGLTTIERLKQHSSDLKDFADDQEASTQLGILVDMSLPSWKKRLFVVNLENDSILISGMCAHGQCNDLHAEEVTFSNTPGSNCTSDGRYMIGDKYAGQYGLGYKLHGLDSTNSNAFVRNIVLHHYPCVANYEGRATCRSNGCPMVSAEVFEAMAKLIDASQKPVLLWIYK